MSTQSEYARAREAGMSLAEAVAWAAYVRKVREQGREPIDVHEAVRQIREVRP
jgi:hypothetical protein